ncbi:MAG: PD-(D/E)XK nuclease family protein [Terracidiphilus sp.]|jgi:probable DNA repair protein
MGKRAKTEPGSQAEIDAWLRNGGLVVTASDRAARALELAFHRARRAEGLAAWLAPNILDWKSFAQAEWEKRALDGRLLLNPLQEQSLWADIAGADRHLATLLEGPRHRLAAMAMEAHELLCAYAPRFLRENARSGWQQDAAAFSNWLTAFDEICRAGNLLSPARLPLELIALLGNPPAETGQAERPPLLLAGFDRILPVQRALFDAWGAWRQAALDEPADHLLFHEAPDAQAELTACALWCSRQIAANPRARLLVVTQDASGRRGEIERAFLRHTSPAATPLFEFSLGVPLSQVALPESAYLLLRWLSVPLAEHELDWLLSTGNAAASLQENSALQAHMRSLRRRSLAQPSWTLAAFLGQQSGQQLPPAWVARMSEAQRLLAEFARRPSAAADPLDWAELAPRLLASAGWPGTRSLSSAEFQAARRWNQALETCGSLGFDGRRISWSDFLSILARALDETLFAPESRDAPIQIAGPAESAGLTADAIWFLGADEDAWPPRGATHPLLPPEVQREADLPHATPQLDWDLAHAITNRLIAAAPQVHFSYAKQNETAEARPSRLIAQFAGSPQPLTPELTAPLSPSPQTVTFEDFSQIPYVAAATKVEGGAGVLTAQSQCPFKAFATARLAAQDWSPAEAGLTAAQRGILLHAVLHAVWGGPPVGIRTHEELQKLNDLTSFVAAHVQRALQQELRSNLRERMPRRYLELEEQRLTRLVTEWLDYEAARIEFVVTITEVDSTVQIAALTFDLRLDRIDRLNDRSLLVIDYKSGDVSPKSWELPRPDDVQLPLYAGFALDPKEELGGLVFAKVRAGDLEFDGRVGDAKATLLAGLSSGSRLVKKKFSPELMNDWRDHIEQLAKDFLAGRAEVDPREYPKTCERCGLQTLCRIQENHAQLEAEDDPDGDEEEADE